MTEKEIFDSLVSKDPNPGTKDRLFSEGDYILVPNWVTGTNEEDGYYKLPRHGTKKFYKKYNLTNQILYDVLVLGLTNINDRPKCPVCGNEIKFRRNLLGKYSGYNDTCCNKCHMDLVRVLATTGDALKRSVATRMANGGYDHMFGNTYRKDTPIKQSTRDKLSKANKGKKRSPEVIEKNQLSHIKYYKEHPEAVEKLTMNYRNSDKGRVEINKSPKGYFTHLSSWEKRFVLFCDKLDFISVIENPKPIKYKFEGVIHNYFPDVLLTFTNEKKLLIEIKPNYYLNDKKNKAKFKAGKEYTLNNSETYISYEVFTEDILFGGNRYSTSIDENLTEKLLSFIK